jgi:hypothetical protein
MPVYLKDPSAVLDYKVDWSPWLQDSEVVTGSAWVSADVTITVDSNSHDNTSATVWLSGGTAGVDYQLTNHITTSMARTDERTITIACRQR